MKDYATSLIIVAPNPSNTGTQITVKPGHGARFGAVPFKATIHPKDEMPDLDNAEKVLVTAKDGDTFTIQRALSPTTAKYIQAGDRISNSLFYEDFQELLDFAKLPGPTGPAGPTGPQGPQGTPGVDGDTWHNGSGAPAGTLGKVGDYYLNNSDGSVYEKTAASTWTVTTNIKGPAGSGTGDMVASTYDPAGGARQVAFADESIKKSGDTMTGGLKIESTNAAYRAVNTSSTQNTTASLRVYSSASTMANQAGVRLVSYVNSADATSGYSQFDQINYQGNWVSNLMRFDFPNARIMVYQNFLPDLNNTRLLGASNVYWSQLYASRQYLNNTAYFDGATAGTAALTGSLTTTGAITTPSIKVTDTNQSINSDNSARFLRLSGGTANDGATLLLVGSTHASLPNRALARIGTTEVWGWTASGIAPHFNVNVDLGASSTYWRDLYARRHYFNSTAYIDGATAGEATLSGRLNISSGTPAIYLTPTSGSQEEIRAGSGSVMFVNRTAGNYQAHLNNTGLALFASGSLTTPSERLHVVGNGYFTGNVKADGEIESTDTTKGVILKAPNGTRFRLTVGNDGALTTTAI